MTSWLKARFGRHLPVLLTLMFPHCAYLDLVFGEEPTLDPCDPVANYYQADGAHYIERDFVKDDGTLDYQRYFDSQKAGASPCDPLRKAEEQKSQKQP